MAKKKNSELFSSILYIIVGILLIFFPENAVSWAMTIAGIVFIVSGILDMIRKNWAGGAISLIIGLVIIILGWKLVEVVLLVLGVLIAIKGIIALINVFKKSKKNALEILFPILTIVIGIMLAFGGILHIILVIGGVLLAIDGVLGLIGSLKK
jgi:uncharacterized membrane protein HdeD (DUF308 family)